MEDKDYVVLRTYNTVWKIDRKIYSIEGLKLLFPVSINDILYFAVSVFISILLVKFLPFYNKLNYIIKYVIVPYCLMKFLTKQKLDGKLPHKFFLDYLIYLIEPKKYCRFSPINDEKKKIKFSSLIIFRNKKILNKTDLIIKKSKTKRKWGK